MSKLLVDLTPLRVNREFRLMWCAQLVTFFGGMITHVAIPYQVFLLTHSTFQVGLLGAIEFVALMSTALVGGALADTVDRRRMVLLTEGGLLLTSMALALNASAADPHLGLLYVLAGVGPACYGLQRPSWDALLPRVVPAEHLVAAGALAGIRGTFGMIAGPAVGGLLIAGAGLKGAYLVDVATFVVSLALMARMQPTPPPEGVARPSLRGAFDGWGYARTKPVLLGTYLVDMNAMFFGMPTALFPALAVGYGGPRALGVLYAAPAVGALVVSLFSGWASHVRRQGRAILVAAGVWGVAILGFGLSDPLWLAVVFLAIAGAGDMVSGLFRMAIWNTTVPDELRGRMAGIELISYTSGPTLGNLEAGSVAALTTPRFSAGIGGVLCVVGTLALAVALPELRRYSPEPEDHPAGADVGLGEHDVDRRA